MNNEQRAMSKGVFMKKQKFSFITVLAVVMVYTLAGCSDDAAAKDAVPQVPTKIVATATSSNSITISWPAVSGALQYYVYGSESASDTYTRLGITVASFYHTYSYTVSGLLPNTTYYYKVSSYNHLGESSLSSSVSATTVFNFPSNVSAAASTSNSITVTWDSVSGATGYYVYGSSGASGTFTRVQTISSSSTTSYTATGLSPNTAYYYRVSAYRRVGDNASSYIEESSPSSAVFATTAPVTPTNVSATATSSTSITVSWSSVPGAAGYRVYSYVSGNYILEGTVSSSYTSYTVTGLLPNTTYYYGVTAYNSSNVESPQSSYVSVRTLSP
jgi:fibronectin type 3 domain-containing protein